MENKEHTLQGIKDLIAFTDSRKQELDGLIDSWYLKYKSKGFLENDALYKTYDKLEQHLDIEPKWRTAEEYFCMLERAKELASDYYNNQ